MAGSTTTRPTSAASRSEELVRIEKDLARLESNVDGLRTIVEDAVQHLTRGIESNTKAIGQAYDLIRSTNESIDAKTETRWPVIFGVLSLLTVMVGMGGGLVMTIMTGRINPIDATVARHTEDGHPHTTHARIDVQAARFDVFEQWMKHNDANYGKLFDSVQQRLAALENNRFADPVQVQTTLTDVQSRLSALEAWQNVSDDVRRNYETRRTNPDQ